MGGTAGPRMRSAFGMLGIDQEEFWKRTEDSISRMEITFSLYRRLKKLARLKQLGQLDYRSVKPDHEPKA